MRKFLLSLIAIVIFGGLSGHAQSANRKGLFLELRGGTPIGYVYKSNHPDVCNDSMKGGLDMGLGVGYRFATSIHWAFQMKADISSNLSASHYYIEKLLSFAAIFGMRWISSDFAGNKSAYIGFGSGVGLNCGQELGAVIPIEIEVGINLTNKFSLGLYTLPRISVEGSLRSAYDNGSPYNILYESNTSLGAKLSYRF